MKAYFLGGGGGIFLLMKKILPLLVLSAGLCACSTTEPVLVQGPLPPWFEKTIITQENYIFAVGHSSPQAEEQKARDEALANATREFARYCRADIESLDNIYETYAATGSKTKNTVSLESRNQLRVNAFVRHSLAQEWYLQRQKNNYLASVLLKIPKEEMDRISSEKNARVSVDIALYYEDGSKKLQPLAEGSVLRSGDGYALYARPGDTSYLYVYQVDALNKSFRLFPNSQFKTASNPVARGAQLWIPNGDDVLFLDETTGKESLYLFASSERIEELEGGAAALTRKDLDYVAHIKKMGAAGLRPKSDASPVLPHVGSDVVEVKNKLQAAGGFVYETWFWHK